jgi:hypothetical protein
MNSACELPRTRSAAVLCARDAIEGGRAQKRDRGSPAKATPESPPLRKFSKVLEKKKKKKKGRAGAPWE